MLKLKRITPVFTSILVTCDKYSEPEHIEGSEVIDPSKAKVMVKEYQTVLCIGNAVRLVKPGDKVVINPMKYAKFKQVRQNSLREDLESYEKEIVGFDFPTLFVDGKECLLLDERDILYIVNEGEEVEDLPDTVEGV